MKILSTRKKEGSKEKNKMEFDREEDYFLIR